jgi:hypothetical protein
MTGAATPATALAQKLEQDPCSVPGTCSNFTYVAPVLVLATPIQSVSVEYSVYDYKPALLLIKSTYKVDGVSTDIASVFDTAAGSRLSCTSELVQGSRRYSCNITASTAEALQLVATAPNMAKVTEPLVQTVAYSGPGEACGGAPADHLLQQQALGPAQFADLQRDNMPDVLP